MKYPEPIQKRLDATDRRRKTLMESEGWAAPDYESGLQLMFILMGGWPAWEKLNPENRQKVVDFVWTDELVKKFVLQEANKYNVFDRAGLDIWIEKFKRQTYDER